MENTVGMLGLGIMGSVMSKNLLAAGFEVVGYDVLPEKVAALESIGGVGAASARELARKSRVIVSVLPTEASVMESAREVGAVAGPGQIFVECSTMPLDTKIQAATILDEAGVDVLDCPLSGTGAQAVNKDLSVYASGEKAVYEQCISVFEGFARSHYFIGAYGTGSKMKFVANLLVAIHNVSAAEAFVLGMKAGLDPQQILEVVSDGAGTSRMFEVRGPMMVANEYEQATMKVDVWQKDMKIIGAFANDLKCPTPLFAASVQIYTNALAHGRDKEDTASVCAILAEMAGLKRD